ncbi:MAG: T9SS type A sorting domain-containing protein [Saprospiraceae bacterium]|nr:T9SS type A sorting domain-containing protein [Saprospiraceae bacterium]
MGKSTLLTFLLILFSAACINGQTLFFEEDFETDGNGTRYTSSNEFFDGEDDYFGRVFGPTLEYGASGSTNVITLTGAGSSSSQIGNYTGYNGMHLICGEDLDDDGGDGLDTKTITFTIDISFASTITFRGLFGAGNENVCNDGNAYDGADYMKVFYDVDGGGMVEALCFNADIGCNIPTDVFNEPLHHDPNCDGDGGEGDLMSGALTEYSFSIPDGTTLTLKIEVYMDAAEEEIAFDWFRLYAVTVVPISLTRFEAAQTEAGVLVEWETEQEQSNDFFEIERSIDGSDFVSIGRIEGAGDSYEAIAYQFLDKQLPSHGELLYYRLKQTDFDGTATYSDIRSVRMESNANNALSISPNPSDQETIQVQWTGVNPTEMSVIRIFDLQGRMIQSWQVEPGNTGIGLDLSTFNNGLYILEWRSGANVQTERFVKIVR